MARSRNIKPGFFVNADLVELPPLVRLLFIGLWTLADREGRLEDRPSQIKMQVLPGDDIDTGQALDLLGANTFITRYEVDGKRYIQISNFSKHQNPHVKEPKSTIPAPGQALKVAEIERGNANSIPDSCKHRTCLVLAGLIPDSGFLIPDSKEKPMGTSPKQKIFTPPCPDDVGEYMLEIGYHGNAQQFCDYYASKGWMIGKTKMKDWRAAVRTWRSNEMKRAKQEPVRSQPDWMVGVR